MRMKDGTWGYHPAGKKDGQAPRQSPEDHNKVDPGNPKSLTVER